MSGGFSDILRSLEEKDARKLERKVPSWSGVAIEVPQAVNFQQCSGEVAARYKASLVAPGSRVADLTGGLGVDSWAFAGVASAVWYNERDAVLLDAVRRNFAALGVSNVVFNGFDITPQAIDWQEALKDFRPDVIYLDPARRDAAGRKVFLLEDCSPDVVSLMPTLLTIAPQVIVKVSPMADLTMLRRRLQNYLSEIHIIGADNECKELLCICQNNPTFNGITLFENGSVFAAQKKILQTSASLHPSASQSELLSPCTPRGLRGVPLRLSELVDPSSSSGHGEALFAKLSSAAETKPDEKLLFVPSASMVKAGFGPGMCLMGYNEGLSHFGTFWEVVENLPFASSVIKELGRRYPVADVTARGVPVSSEQLRAKIRTKPGGPVHIFACVLDGERRILITKQMPCPK